jgi:hypothetical protein
LVARVGEFLRGDFDAYDREVGELHTALPPPANPISDEADDEVRGWLALAGHQDYLQAERHFASRQNQLATQMLRELGAFMQYTEAKAAHLEGQRGDVAAASRSRTAMEQAIARGGTSSSWFNRLRSSVARSDSSAHALIVRGDEFPAASARSFDEQLESTPPGAKLDRWRRRLADQLASDSHDVYAAGLGALGRLLGYSAVFPKYGAATDCRWHGVFGNSRQALTFECKIEHGPDAEIDAHAVGQAHNQRARAMAELEPRGYAVRGLIVTHLDRLAADAAPGLGDIVVLRRDAVAALHHRVDSLLATFAANWSLADPQARVNAGEALVAHLPPTDWLLEAVDQADRFLAADSLLSAWPD